MSDVEHEFVVENRELRAELERVRTVARAAIARAVAELDRADGRHSPFYDEALEVVDRTVPAGRSDR